MRHLGYPEGILSTFAAIVMRESSGRERAYNPSGAAGLLQFMRGWYSGAWDYPAFDPFDPEQNLRAGLHIWREQGFGPWAM